MHLKHSVKKPSSPKKLTKKTTHLQKRAKHSAIRLTHVTRGGHAHAGGHKVDEWYNGDENSEHEEHSHHPPAGVRAYSFADKAYKVSFRMESQKDQAFTVDIYEGETFLDCITRHQLPLFTQCSLPSEVMQEEQYWAGPNGCGDCIGFIPPDKVKHLEPMWPQETDKVRQFIKNRVHWYNTGRDKGDVDRIRFLCVTNFTPALDGAEIYMPTNHYYKEVFVQDRGRLQDI